MRYQLGKEKNKIVSVFPHKSFKVGSCSLSLLGLFGGLDLNIRGYFSCSMAMIIPQKNLGDNISIDDAFDDEISGIYFLQRFTR